ncbi:MAG TPA: zinc-binding dehydrogenase, partial [Acidimicrobiales bacterium]|nr:zinc-binding dehydrogenase [Acidimicrobiales bacterium]
GIHPVGGPGSLTLTWPTLNDHNASPEVRRRRAADVFALVARGSLQPHIDLGLGLTDAAEAHRRLERGQVLGKLVLDAQS